MVSLVIQQPNWRVTSQQQQFSHLPSSACLPDRFRTLQVATRCSTSQLDLDDGDDSVMDSPLEASSAEEADGGNASESDAGAAGAEGGTLGPHAAVYASLRHLRLLSEVKNAVADFWPEWAAGRYRLLKNDALLPSAPAPEEAAGILRSVALTALFVSRHVRLATYPRDALVVGAVEALRLKPPRGDSDSIGGGAESIDGSPGLALLCPDALHYAFFSLSTIGRDLYWQEEMEILCQGLPSAPLNLLQTVNVLESLANARHWTPHLPLLERRVAASATPGSNRSLRYLLRCMQALVTLGHTPHELIDLAAVELENDVWDWRAGCRMAWSLALANEVDSAACTALLGALVAHAGDPPELKAKGSGRAARRQYAYSLLMLWQLCLTLQHLRPQLWGQLQQGGPEMAAVLEAARAKWSGEGRAKFMQPSATQRDVFYVAQSIGLNAVLETEVQGLSVDIADARQSLVIEVDGPSHFARTRPDLGIGNSLWKRRVLEASGWSVINISTKAWAELRGGEAQRRYLQGAVAAAQERLAAKGGGGGGHSATESASDYM